VPVRLRVNTSVRWLRVRGQDVGSRDEGKQVINSPQKNEIRIVMNKGVRWL
jgi:hypothetical protein